MLGRLFAPDKRDYPMRAALPSVAVPAFKFWRPGVVLDQRQTSQCVAYSWSAFELCSPIRTKDGDPPAAFYAKCQAIDEWSGSPHDGTSVRAGAKIMQQQGHIGEYVFDTDVDVVRQWILTKGPVVFGTNWYQQSFTPSPAGFIGLGGPLAGGHAYLVDGYSDRRSAFRCRNSWGPAWGANGSFWLSLADARRLLSEDGEACATLEVKIP